jgi:hypothetical protein
MGSSRDDPKAEALIEIRQNINRQISRGSELGRPPYFLSVGIFQMIDRGSSLAPEFLYSSRIISYPPFDIVSRRWTPLRTLVTLAPSTLGPLFPKISFTLLRYCPRVSPRRYRGSLIETLLTVRSPFLISLRGWRMSTLRTVSNQATLVAPLRNTSPHRPRRRGSPRRRGKPPQPPFLRTAEEAIKLVTRLFRLLLNPSWLARNASELTSSLSFSRRPPSSILLRQMPLSSKLCLRSEKTSDECPIRSFDVSGTKKPFGSSMSVSEIASLG